jgi:hypothetical protein
LAGSYSYTLAVFPFRTQHSRVKCFCFFCSGEGSPLSRTMYLDEVADDPLLNEGGSDSSQEDSEPIGRRSHFLRCLNVNTFF